MSNQLVIKGSSKELVSYGSQIEEQHIIPYSGKDEFDEYSEEHLIEKVSKPLIDSIGFLYGKLAYLSDRLITSPFIGANYLLKKVSGVSFPEAHHKLLESNRSFLKKLKSEFINKDDLRLIASCVGTYGAFLWAKYVHQKAFPKQFPKEKVTRKMKKASIDWKIARIFEKHRYLLYLLGSRYLVSHGFLKWKKEDATIASLYLIATKSPEFILKHFYQDQKKETVWIEEQLIKWDRMAKKYSLKGETLASIIFAYLLGNKCMDKPKKAALMMVGGKLAFRGSSKVMKGFLHRKIEKVSPQAKDKIKKFYPWCFSALAGGFFISRIFKQTPANGALYGTLLYFLYRNHVVLKDFDLFQEVLAGFVRKGMMEEESAAKIAEALSACGHNLKKFETDLGQILLEDSHFPNTEVKITKNLCYNHLIRLSKIMTSNSVIELNSERILKAVKRKDELEIQCALREVYFYNRRLSRKKSLPSSCFQDLLDDSFQVPVQIGRFK
ncbi:MAG TPA: hypothetical protein P5048_02325, partial [Chlamydiales bacterium]|nr:hypothetical protein [Chlamydiales bacterium]